MKRVGKAAVILLILICASVGRSAEGLVAYFPFNGDAGDSSGNGHHGVVHGAQNATVRFNNPTGALRFNGFDYYVSIPDSPEFHFTNQVSISVWINFSYGVWQERRNPRIMSKGYNAGFEIGTVGWEQQRQVYWYKPTTMIATPT